MLVNPVHAALALGFVLCALSARDAHADAPGGAARYAAASYGYGEAPAWSARPALDMRRSAPPSADALAAPPEEPDDEEEGASSPVEQAAPPPSQEAPLTGYAARTNFDRQTASGEAGNARLPMAAHADLPLPSLVEVTNLENGRTSVVRVNDRLTGQSDAILSVSDRAARDLGIGSRARVRLRVLGPAPRHETAPETAHETALAQTEGPISLLPPNSAVHESPPAQTNVVAAAWQAPQTPASALGAYMVQVGAFSDPANAARVRDAIASVGPALIEPRQTASGTLYRVRLGPLEDRPAAEAARTRLTALGYGNAIVAPR